MKLHNSFMELHNSFIQLQTFPNEFDRAPDLNYVSPQSGLFMEFHN